MRSLKATSPSKLVLRSRMSTYSRYEALMLLKPSTDIADPTVTHLAGPRHGQRPQQQRVGPAERGGVGADAQRERDDRHEREARVGGEHAAAVADVLRQALEPPESPDSVACRFWAMTRLDERRGGRFNGLRRSATRSVERYVDQMA